MTSRSETRNTSIMAGIASRGAVATGVLGILAAFMAVIGNGDFVGAGLCLIASALAFGIPAIAGSRG